jgi:hypothetical protein
MPRFTGGSKSVTVGWRSGFIIIRGSTIGGWLSHPGGTSCAQDLGSPSTVSKPSSLERG